MEFLTILYLGILYSSGWVAFRVYRIQETKNLYKYRGKDLLLYALCGYLFILPVFLLFKNFSIVEAIVYHLGGLLFSVAVSEYIISEHLQRLSWGIIVLFMCIGFLSGFLLPPYRWKDGEYCASVHYYNPDSGNESNYHLKVEIEEGKVIKINFPRGGWLDEDHFEPEPLDEHGEAIVTDDRDYEYTISNLKRGECY